MASRPVHPALRARVRSIEVVTSSGGVEVLPSSSSVLGVQLAGRIRHGDVLLATAGVTGIQQSVCRYDHVGETTSILVRFTPQGAACLAPGSELAGTRAALTELIATDRARQLEERIGDGDDPVAVVQALLLDLPFEEDPLIAHAVALLETCTVADVARAVGLGERQLERRFFRAIGLPPKRFQSLRRFERAVAAAPHAPSLTEIALEAGYYDQSHFIREFRRFAGAAPRRFLGPMSDPYNRAPRGRRTMSP